MSEDPSGLEPVFIAASVAEAEWVERMLEAEGIDYEVTPEPFVRGVLVSSCRMGLLFRVDAGQAESCRRMFRMARLDKGIVDGEG